MKKLETYLFFDRSCAEAMRFYQRVFGGNLRMVPASDAPPAQVPPGAKELIMHAHLQSDGAVIMASDWMDSAPYPGKAGFSVCLTVPTAAEAKGLFEKLAEGGRVTMPFAPTFYSDGFGMLVDRFATPWMVMAEQKAEQKTGTSGTSR